MKLASWRVPCRSASHPAANGSSFGAIRPSSPPACSATRCCGCGVGMPDELHRARQRLARRLGSIEPAPTWTSVRVPPHPPDESLRRPAPHPALTGLAPFSSRRRYDDHGAAHPAGALPGCHHHEPGAAPGLVCPALRSLALRPPPRHAVAREELGDYEVLRCASWRSPTQSRPLLRWRAGPRTRRGRPDSPQTGADPAQPRWTREWSGCAQ